MGPGRNANLIRSRDEWDLLKSKKNVFLAVGEALSVCDLGWSKGNHVGKEKGASKQTCGNGHGYLGLIM